MSKKKLWFLGAGLLLMLIWMFAGCSFVIHKFGGDYAAEPVSIPAGLRPTARALVEKAFADVDPEKLIDHHTHVLGLGVGGTGNYVNERMHSWLHPLHRIRFLVYKSAAAIDDENQADQQYLDRLIELMRNQPSRGKYHLLAFDKHYRKDGTVDDRATEFYVPNEYVFSLAEKYPDLFVPAISVHPYRPDALEELVKWSKKGARLVKWLPNAMGMDPSHPKCEPFYRIMKQNDMVLLIHSGEEKAVHAEENQKLGNPLLLRKPLDMGVKVIAAHCASLGDNEDLDHPERITTTNFDLFLRLMDEPKYEGLLFGEISAITQANRLPGPLLKLLQRQDLHDRLVNGSDYPLPAVNVVIRTKTLVSHGFITEEERQALNEIYDNNPLLFDYVLKRTLRHPRSGQQLQPTLFTNTP